MSFSQFSDISRNDGYPFQNCGSHSSDYFANVAIRDLRNYAVNLFKICRIMSMNLSGKMSRPCEMIGPETPAPLPPS